MNQHLSGLPAWLVQRLSAAYMVMYSMLVLGWWLFAPVPDYSAWRSLFSHPLYSVTSAMFFLALLLHAWVGVRDVILDYAGQTAALRLLLLSLLGGWLIALGFWCTRILVAEIAV